MALTGCEDNGVMNIQEMEVPDGYALSAGTSTIFKNSSYAYDTDADWVQTFQPTPYALHMATVFMTTP